MPVGNIHKPVFKGEPVFEGESFKLASWCTGEHKPLDSSNTQSLIHVLSLVDNIGLLQLAGNRAAKHH
jgi:hypothetical protein